MVGFKELLNSSSMLETMLLEEASRPVGFGLGGCANSAREGERESD